MTKGTAGFILRLVREAKKNRIKAVMAGTRKEKESYEKKAKAFVKGAAEAQELFGGTVEKR